MSGDRASMLRARVDELSDAQRRALAESLARAGAVRTTDRLVAFLVLDGTAAPTDEELRAFLAERLPDHMIPSRFVVLDRLPRTPAGKLDRRALRHATAEALGGSDSRRTSAPTSAGPRTEIEAKLAAIWRDVLKVEDVGVDDDFFEIGGDSLLSIRVIARAGREGLRISPERFFERPTIAHLAASLDRARNRSAAADPHTPLTDPLGEAPLTPIQHWFLDAIPRHRDRWNQSYLLELGHALDAAQFRVVIDELVTHHDALRLRLVCRDGLWRQEFMPPDSAPPYRVIVLGDTSREVYASRVVEECEREHASLRLEDGKLFRALLFEGDAGWRRVLLLGHHLVLDSVSWSVILEDLATLVVQAATGAPLRLPGRTASARAWAIALADAAATPAVAEGAAHWLEMPHDDSSPRVLAARSVLDDPSLVELAGCYRDGDVVTLALDAEESRALMLETPRRMDAPAQAVLLAALLLAWHDWTAEDTLRLDLEGHGRDVPGATLDVSRTVGWFTTVFPVHLALPRGIANGAGPSPEAAVHAVRGALEALPLHGAAHGLARYLAPDESLRDALAARPRPALLFNLLGVHDVALAPASRLRATDEPQGEPRHPDAPRPYVLELNARVEGGSLIVSIAYGRHAFATDTVERFATALRGALARLTRPAAAPPVAPGIDAASLAIVGDLLAELDDA